MRIRPTPHAVLMPALLASVVAASAAGVALTAGSPTARTANPHPHSAAPLARVQPPSTPRRPHVCGRSILNSPYDYTGRPGRYRSGTAGLPTYGTAGSDFPHAKHGVVLRTGRHDYPSYKLAARTVYYLLPGIHVGSIQAKRYDAFVGGFAKGVRSVLTGNYTLGGVAIDSNWTDGNQPGVTIEYLTIEKFRPDVDAGAINQDTNTDWRIRNNTIRLNVPGAGVMVGSRNTLRHNCLTRNGQYGFQSFAVNRWGHDRLTGGPYDIVIEGNEISFNDTCDLEGTVTNRAAGLVHHNPVPKRLRNPHCGAVSGDGNQGGFKLWRTNGVVISHNFIHRNYGTAIWVDTNNANTTITGNTITDNDGAAVFEEISYNFAITGNYMARNDWFGGLGNRGFPQPAIYVSESGSDRHFGGIPRCAERACAEDQPDLSARSVIRGNTLVDNGGGVFLWQNSNRYCSSGIDDNCTLVKGPFTIASCRANLRSASVNTRTYVGRITGSPAEDWWDGCMWKTENVLVTHNVIDFDRAHIPHCKHAAWPACGANGVFSQYGGPPSGEPGWVVPTSITFDQGNRWSANIYRGPSTFYAWNQGNGKNPVSWAHWTGKRASGDRCGSHDERRSGYCTGPFGQDAGSSWSPRSHSQPGTASPRIVFLWDQFAELRGNSSPAGRR